MRRPTAALLALCLAASPLGAEVVAETPALTVSSAAPRGTRPGGLAAGVLPGRNGKTPAVGVGVGLKEGPLLQSLVWGGSGAVVGSFAGPVGAALGGAAGAAAGLVVSLFVVPRVQPGMDRAP